MRAVAAALVGTMALAMVPGAAHAEWSALRPMDARGWSASNDVDVAVARNGAALMAWTGMYGRELKVRVRRVSASGRLGRVRTVSGPDSGTFGQVSVALDDDGDALIAWAVYEDASSSWQVWTRRLSRGGAPGPFRRLSTPGVSSWRPRAALTPRGQGAVIFDESVPSDGWRQVLRRVSRSSGLGRARYLPAAGQFSPDLQATRDGDFVYAGVTREGVLKAFRLLPNDRLVSRGLSAGTPMRDTGVGVGVDRRGTAYFTYLAKSDDRAVLWTRAWTRARRVSPARRITPRGHTVIVATSGTDLQGDTIVSWSEGTASEYLTLHSRIWRRDGSLGAVQKLGPIQGWADFHGLYAPAPDLALDDDGDGVVAWPSEPGVYHEVAWARRVRPDGTLGGRVRLRDHAAPYAVGITPRGRARVGITEQGKSNRLFLTTGP